LTKHDISEIVGGTRRELLSMPWDEYLDYPALNGSVIVPGQTSMLHLKDAWEKPDKDSDAKQYGRMVHCLLLEPKHFQTRFRAWDGRRAGTAYEEFCIEAAVAGAEVVKATGEYSLEVALQAAPSFLGHKTIQALIREGHAEQTVLWPELGVQMKGRIDWISTGEHVLTDLKNTRMSSDRLFGKQFFDLGYGIKLALYQRGLQAVTGELWPVVVLAVENQRPYDVVPYPVPAAVLDAGWDEAQRIIERLKRAIETDEWPGKSEGGYGALYVPYYVMQDELEVRNLDE
jgi:hypothetical protein